MHLEKQVDFRSDPFNILFWLKTPGLDLLDVKGLTFKGQRMCFWKLRCLRVKGIQGSNVIYSKTKANYDPWKVCISYG